MSTVDAPQNKSLVLLAVVVLLVCALAAAVSTAGESPADRKLPEIRLRSRDVRRVRRVRTSWGNYFQYAASKKPLHVLVVVHGSIGDSETADDLAERYIKRWTEFADQHNLLVIAPAFDNDNFQKAYGGYRGLFGRVIGADDFVTRIVDRYADTVPNWNGRFSVYGHSAGAQFVVRFAILHADRLTAAVASAPGRYAYPDADAAWPYGMGPFERKLNWGEGVVNTERVSPTADAFLAAAKLPIVLVVGANDLEQQPKRPAHVGETRIELAQSWMQAMHDLARDNGEASLVRLLVVPNVGHNSAALTPHCQDALVQIWSR